MLREGHSVMHCARVIMCDPKTIRNVRSSKNHERRKNCTFGRKSTIFRAELDSRRKIVAELALKNEAGIALYPSAAAIAAACPFVCSRSTVLRYLKHEGIVSRVRPKLPKTSEEDHKRRFDFAISQLALISKNASRRYIFTDEKIFDTNERGARRMFIKIGTQPRPRLKQHWAPKVMVWGAIGLNYRKLIVFEVGERVTSRVYVDKVLPSIVERISHRRDEVLIQDGAKPHTALATMKFLEEHKIEAPAWPARSPDLNVVENMWSLVERRLGDNRGSNSKALARAVRTAWNAIPTSTVNALVSDFENRLIRCAQLRGRYVQ